MEQGTLPDSVLLSLTHLEKCMGKTCQIRLARALVYSPAAGRASGSLYQGPYDAASADTGAVQALADTGALCQVRRTVTRIIPLTLHNLALIEPKLSADSV